MKSAVEELKKKGNAAYRRRGFAFLKSALSLAR